MLISLLLTLLVIAVILYVVNLVIDMMGLSQPVRVIAMLIIGLIALFYVLGLFGIVANQTPLIK